jgi:hypothetical protein
MVTFIEERKKQKRLIYIFIIILLITFLVLWQGFLKKTKIKPQEVGTPVSTGGKIKINFGTLENPILKEFQDFKMIPPFEGEKGRENPFLPY